MKTLRNEKGIALVMVLVLALISLAIVAALVYMVLQGTKSSGFLKRYESAREAGMGGTELVAALIADRGELVIPTLVDFPNRCDCFDTLDPNDNRDSLGNRTCLCDKLCSPTTDWPVACSATFDPMSNS